MNIYTFDRARSSARLLGGALLLGSVGLCACEVGGVIGAAGPFPARDLWISADRASAGTLGRDDLLGCDALLNPAREGASNVMVGVALRHAHLAEVIGTGAAVAVLQARHHEQAKKPTGILG